MIELLANRNRISPNLSVMVVCIDEDDIRDAREDCPEYRHFFLIDDYLKHKDEFQVHLMTEKVSRALGDNLRRLHEEVV